MDRIARFIAGTYNGEAFLFDRFELRMVNIANSDDMLIWLDALRWDKADLHELVPAGQPRAQAAIKKPGLKWPEQTA